MNILFITQWYPNRQQPFYGIFVREHARAIQSAGHTVQVLALSLHKSKSIFKKKLYHYTDENGIKTIQCELHSYFKDLLYHLPQVQFFFLNQAYKREVSTFKADIIHSHTIYPAGIWGHDLAKRLETPHIITEHWSRLTNFASSFYFAKAREAYQSAAALLPVSNYLKNNIQSVVPGLSDDKFSIIGNVVDESLFRYQPNENPSHEITFCAVATWQHKKNPDKMPELFIDALSELQKNAPQTFKLVIIGGGNKLPDLQTRCEKANLKTRFTGFLPKEKIAEELHKADYFVHASHIETFSIVVAEALACGVPVICSSAGALVELINRKNGVLTNNTKAEWVTAIEHALSTTYNRQAIAEELNERFSREAIGLKIASVYQKTKEG